MTTIETKIKIDNNWLTEQWSVCDLTGSEKQINWASSLRHQMLTNFVIFASDHKDNPQILTLREQMASVVSTQTDSKFYIEYQKDFRSAIKSCR